MIVHEHGKWVLKTADGSRTLGTHATKEEAEAQERAVQASKHAKDHQDGARVNRFERFDASSLKPPRRLDNGFLRVEGRIARCGVQEYRRHDGTVRKELRLPEVVFDEGSLASFHQLPVTNRHPPGLLDAKNARQYMIGSVGESVRRDGEFVAASIMITDADAIAAAEAGRSQLSNGYSCRLDETPGEHPIYGAYDAVQRDIVGNHVALVDAARAGPEARLRLDGADAATGDFPQGQEGMVGSEKNPGSQGAHTMGLKMKLDGMEIEVADANAQAIVERAIAVARKDGEDKAAAEKLRADGAAKTFLELQKNFDALDGRVKALDGKTVKCDECDGEGEVDGEDCEACDGEGTIKMDVLCDAKKHADSVARRDARMRKEGAKQGQEHAALVAQAREVLGKNAKLDGLKAIDIRKQVLAKEPSTKDLKLDGRSEEFVNAAYEVVMAGRPAPIAPIDRVRAVQDAAATSIEPEEGDARKRYLQRLDSLNVKKAAK